VRLSAILAVVEGAARSAAAPDTVAVVSAAQDGDTEVVVQARRIVAVGNVPLVVTADRGLRGRLPAGSLVAGPEWLNRLVGR
jgi:2-methylisocitrate lyase-like PEP mutase family enzyme